MASSKDPAKTLQQPSNTQKAVLREIWQAGTLDIPDVSLPLNPFTQPIGTQPFWHLLLRTKENRATLHKLIVATVIMICVPLAAFFAARTYLFSHLSPNDQLMYSGLLAVMAVNAVSFGFVIYAWFIDVPADDGESSPQVGKESLTSAQNDSNKLAQQTDKPSVNKQQPTTKQNNNNNNKSKDKGKEAPTDTTDKQPAIHKRKKGQQSRK